MRLGAVTIAIVVGMSAAPACACSPPMLSPPPPPRAGASEADAAALSVAWAAAQKTANEARELQLAADDQRRLFETAGSVLVARIDRLEEARSFLVPVQWLKGEPVAGELELALSTWTTCRAVAAVNGVHGTPGEVFVVYLNGNALLQAETLEARPVSKIVDPETLALLMKMPE
jgi:hypothetical protein